MINRIMDNLEGLEDLTSLWTFDEDIDDLKKQLESKTKELEAVKEAAIEQTKKYDDNVKKLIRLLGRAYKERDEAKLNLQKLLLLQNPSIMVNSTTATMAALPSFFSQNYPLNAVNNTTAHAIPCSKNYQVLDSVAQSGSYSLLPVPQTPPQVADAPQVPATPLTVRPHKARGRPRTACTNSQMFNGSSSAAASSLASSCSSFGLTDQIPMPKRQRPYIQID